MSAAVYHGKGWVDGRVHAAFDWNGKPVEYRPGGSFMAARDPESGKIVIFGGEYPVEDGYVFQDTTALYDRASHRIEVREGENRGTADPHPVVHAEMGVFVDEDT